MEHRTVYVFRRVFGLILYGLAYTALWPGLTYPVVSIHGNPTFWSPNSKLSIGLGSYQEFMEPTSRSTLQLVEELYNSQYYFPCGMIVLFSILSPIIKLFLILYGEIVGNIFKVKIEGTRHSKLVDLRKGLRVIAKYQCVDVFLSIITRQLLNSDFITCTLETGFYYFAFYSFMSIIASQIIDANPPVEEDNTVMKPVPGPPPITASAPSMTTLDIFLLFCSVSMFLVGIAWSIGFPILCVKFLFQSKIVIGESVASLMSFMMDASSPTASITDMFCSLLIVATVVVIPTISVTLSVILQCCDRNKSRLYGFAKFTSLLADWSLVDVFAVALMTSLFAFASFSILRASAPWGFYCVLMAAMSAYEVIKAIQTSMLDAPGSTAGYRPVSPGITIPTASELVPYPAKSSDDGIYSDDSGVYNDEENGGGIVNEKTPIELRTRRYKGADYSPVSDTSGDDEHYRSSSQHHHSQGGGQQVVLKSNMITVIVTIIKRLGLPFFMLKAIGWGIFFLVWFMNSGSGSLNLDSLSSTLKSNTPFVTSAIREAGPFGIGMCLDMKEKLHPVSDAKCIEKPYLHYEKHTTYEVLARWMSGFQQVTVNDMYLSIPSDEKFALVVQGEFSLIKLSLFVGQCLASIFGDDTDDTKIPKCSSVFDRIHEWKNVTWSIDVEADCNSVSPFVRNIHVDEVLLGNELKIEEEIAFGFSVPLDNMGEEFKQGIKQSIEPLLTAKSGWIPWGPRMFDLPGLLSHLVDLNVDGGSFTCPKKPN